jgi:hypothetical protein
MNRIIRSRLACIAVLLIVTMAIVGCGQNCFLCNRFCLSLAGSGGAFIVIPCMLTLCPSCLESAGSPRPLQMSQLCEENPADCVATFEQMQMAAIELCEEHPEECQQAFDAWVESLDPDAEPQADSPNYR